MTFWIVTALMALAVAGLLAFVLLRGRVGQADISPVEYDLKVYRDQLKEVDRDLARGVIAEGDAERIRAEISRRILAADAQARAVAANPAGSAPGLSRAMAIVLMLVVGGGSLWTYNQLGALGYGDLGLAQRIEIADAIRAGRPAQAMVEADVPVMEPPAELGPDYLKLVDQLRATVAERPDDMTGLRLLARHESAIGNFPAAHRAQARVIELSGPSATADDYASYADMLILAAGGYVSPEAEAALQETLRRDGGNGVARYYVGLMMAQNGRPDRAFRVWNQLLIDSQPDAPWIGPIQMQIEDAARLAGVPYEPPAPRAGKEDGDAPRGPSAADIQAAGDMTPEERIAMIRGMVEGLAGRLADEGGPASDWARLISALGVLGDTEEARAILVNAREMFAEDPSAIDMINRAAERAGVGE